MSVLSVNWRPKKAAKKLQMNWNTVIGARGRCKVGVRNWTGKDGQEYQSNQIEKFLDPPQTMTMTKTFRFK